MSSTLRWRPKDSNGRALPIAVKFACQECVNSYKSVDWWKGVRAALVKELKEHELEALDELISYMDQNSTHSVELFYT